MSILRGNFFRLGGESATSASPDEVPVPSLIATLFFRDIGHHDNNIAGGNTSGNDGRWIQSKRICFENMTQKQAIQLFEEKRVRTAWDTDREKWWFSIVDVVSVLTDSLDPQSYWRKLKQRLKAEGNETVTNCHGLKMLALDGKMRLTDVADTEQLFRLI